MPTNLPRPCSLCIRRLRPRSLPTRSPSRRLLSSASQDTPSKDPSATASEKPGNKAPAAAPQDGPPDEDSLQGALSRRLEQATEEALTGSTSGFRAVTTEAGFSPALKDRLFEKVQAATFQDAHAAAFAEAGLTAREGTVPAVSAAASAATPLDGHRDAARRRAAHARRRPQAAARGAAGHLPHPGGPGGCPGGKTPVKGAWVGAAQGPEKGRWQNST
ncbi:predicted protein [Verticillium alfalfae VaMs.102]|uniref:Predicted protein n=1 Tax=Verticillium alfalfae (strain VaMs.102 / ATCC MYA-4576 / FGSC 10136) TaxID=526221 RepID=C9SCK2_VERA1|nr:predicted protein [Verticillium alfalfae VaMs.102]EEY16817.1 predicted protein [Verticillium alfalfae VaMs.102]